MAQKYTIVATDAENGTVDIEITVKKTVYKFGVSVQGVMSQEEILERCQHTADEAAGNLQETAVDASLLEGLV